MRYVYLFGVFAFAGTLVALFVGAVAYVAVVGLLYMVDAVQRAWH